jgi:hypothetical protein
MQLSRAFSKHQLFLFAGPDGLDLDLEDARLRTGTPGRKHKWWKSKRFDQMSKRELVHTILVLEFDMIHPDMVVSNPKTGPQTAEGAPRPFYPSPLLVLTSSFRPVLTLSNRTLFLLLSPSMFLCLLSLSSPVLINIFIDSPTILNIARQLGVKAQYRRAPDNSGLIQLLLKGNQKSVDAAREQIEMVDEVCPLVSYRLNHLLDLTLSPFYSSEQRGKPPSPSPFPPPPSVPKSINLSPASPRSSLRLLHPRPLRTPSPPPPSPQTLSFAPSASFTLPSRQSKRSDRRRSSQAYRRGWRGNSMRWHRLSR